MMFTPQQLTGGPRYGESTRIGNWSEDIELDEIKLKDFLKKKEHGALIVNTKQFKLEMALFKSQISQSSDGLLRFGQQVMLRNEQVGYYLAVNPFEHPVGEREATAITVTTANMATPVARNVFTIERVDPNDGFGGDVLHYGQSFRLSLNAPTESGDSSYACWLWSELMGQSSASKISRNQEVSMLAKATGKTIWQCFHPDTRLHIDMDGSEVSANSDLLLRHNATGTFLASDKLPYKNMFGSEFEVHGKCYKSMNKTHNLVSEKKGDITGDYQLRRILGPNVWTIVIQ